MRGAVLLFGPVGLVVVGFAGLTTGVCLPGALCGHFLACNVAQIPVGQLGEQRGWGGSEGIHHWGRNLDYLESHPGL